MCVLVLFYFWAVQRWILFSCGIRIGWPRAGTISNRMAVAMLVECRRKDVPHTHTQFSQIFYFRSNDSGVVPLRVPLIHTHTHSRSNTTGSGQRLFRGRILWRRFKRTRECRVAFRCFPVEWHRLLEILANLQKVRLMT